MCGKNRLLRETVQKISKAFGDNSPHIHQFVDRLQKDYDVYYTNLLKCNKLATPNDGDSWMPAKILDELPEYVSNHKELNDHAKEICLKYLSEEIYRLNPDIIVPFGGRGMVGEVYDLFNVDVPTLSTAIENGDSYDIEFNIGQKSDVVSTVVPSYHFSQNHFKSRVTNIESVSGSSVDKVRDKYWRIIIENIESNT